MVFIDFHFLKNSSSKQSSPDKIIYLSSGLLHARCLTIHLKKYNATFNLFVCLFLVRTSQFCINPTAGAFIDINVYINDILLVLVIKISWFKRWKCKEWFVVKSVLLQDTGRELLPTDIKYYQMFGGEKVTKHIPHY